MCRGPGHRGLFDTVTYCITQRPAPVHAHAYERQSASGLVELDYVVFPPTTNSKLTDEDRVTRRLRTIRPQTLLLCRPHDSQDVLFNINASQGPIILLFLGDGHDERERSGLQIDSDSGRGGVDKVNWNVKADGAGI